MRILVEGLGATQGATDGAGRFLTGLTAALARLEEVDLHVAAGPSTRASLRSLLGSERVIALPGSGRPSRIAAQHIAVPRAARRLGADAVIYTGNYLPIAPGPPAVAVVQNLLLILGTTDYGLSRALYRRWARSRIAKRAAAVVTLSRLMASELERAEPRLHGRTHVVHPGVDVDFFATPSAAPEGLPAPYLLGVGTVWSYRDYPLALAALAASGLPHHLVVAGAAEGRDLAALESQARRLGLEERLHLLGPVSPESMPGLYAGADALLAVSQVEAFSLSVVEAMAAGTPVVAADRSVYPEEVGEAGLLVEPSADALGEALRRVLDSAERARLIEAGHRRAAELSWDSAAARLLEICREATGRERRPPPRA